MGSAASTTDVEDNVDGGPLGVLSTVAASTTEVEEDVDGGPPGAWRHSKRDHLLL
jgi:hypothetical protein